MKNGNKIRDLDVDHLRRIVLDEPLVKKEIIARALALATRLEQPHVGTPEARFVSSVKQLLTGLSPYDVKLDSVSDPADTASPKDQEDKIDFFDFFFVNGGVQDKSLLATLRSQTSRGASNPLSLYFLDANQPKKSRRVKTKNWLVLAASLSRDFFLLDARTTDPGKFIYRVESTRFYDGNASKTSNQPATLEGQRQIEFSLAGVGTKLTLSDRGRRFAVVEPSSGQSNPLPVVKVHAFGEPAPGKSSPLPLVTVNVPGNINGELQNLISFDPTRLELEPNCKVAGLSFDHQGKVLVVGFEGKKSLLTFGVGHAPEERSHGRIAYPNPVRDWAISVNGRLAAVMEHQIYVDELILLMNGTRPSHLLDHSRNTSALTCVAFGPGGKILATGDEGGVVAVRLLEEPHHGKEVLRLLHVGPILKVGFSPDGRILAALAQKKQGPNLGERMIRLWVAQNW